MAQEQARTASVCSGEAIWRGSASRIVDGRSFVLDDGREVRLAAIEVPPLPEGSGAAPGGAAQHPADSQLSAADRSTVADRLAAIRQAVSDVAGDAVKSRPGEQQLAWGNW